MLIGTDGHLLGSATGGNQADAGFHQADVGFGGGVNARAVEADFATAAEGQALRGDDNGFGGVLECEIGVLKTADGVVEIVPFLLLRGDEQEQEIGADGKIGRLIGDHERIEIGAQALEAGVDHGGDVVADGIHLGVKFAAEHAVTQIDQAGAGVARDLLRTILQRFEDDDAGRRGNFGLAPATGSKAESSPAEDS